MMPPLGKQAHFWGDPVALVGILAPSLVWFIPAYAAAFPLSILISKRVPSKKQPGN